MGGIGIFGPETALAPSASMALAGSVLYSPLATKYLAEGDAIYEDHRLLQRALAEFGASGGGRLYLLPPERRSNPTPAYSVRGTIEVPSNVRLEGLGEVRFRATCGLNAPLFKFADNCADAALDGVILDGQCACQSGGPPLVQVGANARRVGLSFRAENACSSVQALGSLYDFRAGGQAGRLDVAALGARGDALFPTDAAIAAGSTALLSPASAFTQDLIGWTVQVPLAGPSDGADTEGRTAGWQSLVASVVAVPSPTTLTLSVAASHAVGGAAPTPAQRAAIYCASPYGGVYSADKAAFDAAAALSNAAGIPVYVPPGNFVASIALTGRASLLGAGQAASVVRAPNRSGTLTLDHCLGSTVSHLTLEGYGPDGDVLAGRKGGVFHSALYARWCQRLTVSHVTTRYHQNGFCFTNEQNHNDDLRLRWLFLDNLMASSIVTSNGTNEGIGGNGFWFFNACEYVEASSLRTHQTGRHGLYIDAGSTGGTGGEVVAAHGYNRDFDIANASVVAAGYLGPADGKSSVGATAYGNRAGTNIRVGTLAIDANYDNASGIVMGGDQYGETAQDSVIGQATITNIGAYAVQLEGVRNRIDSLLLVGFNRPPGCQPSGVQDASYARPIRFQIHAGYDESANSAPPDTTDNSIGAATVVYTGPNPAMFDFPVSVIGGLGVPDALGPTRRVTDGAATAGTSAILSNTMNATAADIGRSVTLAGAAIGNTLYGGVITAVPDAATLTVSPAIEVTVSAKDLWIGHRRAVALRNRVERLVAQTPSQAQLVTTSGTALTAPATGADANWADTPHLSVPMDPVVYATPGAQVLPIRGGLAILDTAAAGGGPIAATLAQVTTAVIGQQLVVVAAQAGHTLLVSGGVNMTGSGGPQDLVTFNAKGDSITLRTYSGRWWMTAHEGVTLS